MLVTLALRYITKRPLQYLMTIMVVAISISLTAAVLLISASLRKGIVYASMPFDMIVGAKGSPVQLIFNTIFLQDVPIGNIDHSLYEQFQRDERVARVIPLAFGDNYRGYKIIGSTSDVFSLRPSANEESIFVLKEGDFFTGNYQAVLGSEVAKSTGLKTGDTFKAAHGLVHNPIPGEEDEHDERYVVTGVLKPMYRPYDMGIFTSMETIWEMHAGHEHEGEDEGDHEDDITALMVTPLDYTGLMQMYQETNQSNEAQAAFPGQVLGNVFSIMGNAEGVLYLISYMVVIIGFLTIILTLHWSVLNRKRDHATLRALGANKRTIFSLILVESFLVMLASGIVGLVIGHGIAYGIGFYMRTISYVYALVEFDLKELVILTAYTLTGVAVSIVPALSVYRQDAASNLNSL
ncbi:MAG: FtsX-like permease family protein [Treponema sp.]|jgi:putative ABC transport system permease protein|nr:FtsX-like permease family protein [Treponema sp.]